MASIKFFAVPVLAAVSGMAQIQQPQLGYMVDSAATLRPVLGIAASASLGDPEIVNVNSFACSRALCLAKTDAGVAAFSPGASGGNNPLVSPYDSPGPAIIALDSEASANPGAWIYFQSTQQLARWQSGVLNAIDFSPGGEILSLRATTDGFDYVVSRVSWGGRGFSPAARPRGVAQNTGTLWIEHYSASDGTVTVLDSSALDSPDTIAAVLLLDGGILFSSKEEITLQRRDGGVLTFPLAGASAFHSAGEGYIEIVASSGMWILRTDPGHEQLFLLPGTPHMSAEARRRAVP